MASNKRRNTPSTNQLHIFAFYVDRSVWLNKDSCSSRIGGIVDGTGPRFHFDDGFTVLSRPVVTANTVPSINHEKP